MKKSVSVAEFTKQFGPITNDLTPGDSIQVTSYGKRHGRYIRGGASGPRPRLDPGRRLAQEEYDVAAGQQLIEAILSDP